MRLGVYPAVTWAYLSGFLLIVAAVMLASFNLQKLGESSRAVMHTQEVLERLSASMASLLDAETAQRGYLLTGDPEYLRSYHTARQRQLPMHVNALRRLTAENPRQQRVLVIFEDLIEQRLALMQRTLELQHRGDRAAAFAVVNTGMGRSLTEQIRTQVAAMRTEEERLLASRVATEQRALIAVLVSIIGTGLLAAFLLWLIRHLAARDASRIRASEERLAESREQLGFALRVAEIGFWEWAAQENRSRWNDQEFELLGVPRTPDKLVETDRFFERVLPEDREEMRERLADAFASGGEFTHEFRVDHPQRGVRWLTGRGRVIHGTRSQWPSGTRMIGLNWDITELKATAEDLRRSNANLAELTTELEQRVVERTRELSEANAELEAFARSVAHDLRAPLRTMQGFSRALLEDFSECLPSEGRQFAVRISAAAERLDQLILDLLAYARLSRSAVRLEPVELSQALMRVQSELREYIQERGATLTMQGASAIVLAQPTLLSQVLTNLVSNAIKFVARDTPPRVEIAFERRGSIVRAWVRDNGIGIAPEHQERIFNVFERLHGHEIYPGTGIGLAIVRRAVERMGGRVGVESRLDQGSAFWFELRAATTVEMSPGERAKVHAPESAI